MVCNGVSIKIFKQPLLRSNTYLLFGAAKEVRRKMHQYIGIQSAFNVTYGNAWGRVYVTIKVLFFGLSVVSFASYPFYFVVSVSDTR